MIVRMLLLREIYQLRRVVRCTFSRDDRLIIYLLTAHAELLRSRKSANHRAGQREDSRRKLRTDGGTKWAAGDVAAALAMHESARDARRRPQWARAARLRSDKDVQRTRTDNGTVAASDID